MFVHINKLILKETQFEGSENV